MLLVLLEGGGLGLELYLSLEDLSFEVFDDLECLEALSVDLEREDLWDLDDLLDSFLTAEALS